jgi:hypothetical protein
VNIYKVEDDGKRGKIVVSATHTKLLLVLHRHEAVSRETRLFSKFSKQTKPSLSSLRPAS